MYAWLDVLRSAYVWQSLMADSVSRLSPPVGLPACQAAHLVYRAFHSSPTVTVLLIQFALTRIFVRNFSALNAGHRSNRPRSGGDCRYSGCDRQRSSATAHQLEP